MMGFPSRSLKLLSTSTTTVVGKATVPSVILHVIWSCLINTATKESSRRAGCRPAETLYTPVVTIVIVPLLRRPLYEWAPIL